MRRVIASLLIWLALLAPALAAAPTYNSKLGVKTETAATSTSTLSVTVPSLTNGYLVVCTAQSALADRTVDSVVFNASENFVEVQDRTHPASNHRLSIWTLASPTATTANVVVTWSGNISTSVFSVFAIEGVNSVGQTAADYFAGLYGYGHLYTSRSDSLTIGCVDARTGSGGSPVTPGSGITEIEETAAGAGATDALLWAGYEAVTTKGESVVIDATLSTAGNLVGGAVELRSAATEACTPSAGGGGGTPIQLALLGVGKPSAGGAAVTCYWQLEASTDRWELEASTDDWLKE